MPEFLVELFVPRAARAEVQCDAKRARIAADELSREGASVRYLRPLFLPEEETCFHLYEAASLDLVHEAARRAELPLDRIIEAITEPNGKEWT